MAKKLNELSTRTPVNTDYMYITTNDGTVEGKQQLINITELPVQGNITVTFNSSQTRDEIQTIINEQDRYIPHGSSITFQFSNGTYTLDDTLYFLGFYGSGYINIWGDHSQTDDLHTNHNVHLNFTSAGNHGINCAHNRMPIIYVEHLKITADDGYSALLVQRQGFFTIRYNYCISVAKTSSGSTGIYVTSGSAALVEDNYVSNNYYGLHVGNNGTLDSTNNDDTGTQPNYGLRASTNGILGKNGTQPAGSTANESFSIGGKIL